ncbi:SufE family protein [Candidatus Blochmanniella camponoti]|uniref:SufE family protein n=1 Tax=Candidatus Blochmanniella camponoti TaxID=108080 RepID=A0AAE9I9L8_9ENTR|nr:SufE family protein [Candidatus Blochmannia herculeanus]URJ24770.1 SufE family protein [Candidatus Blochmannia herculeanus]URJ27171.1 SufE family protein [Candidatus Blochmannia herculeanus]URJ27573.1 SufE family protein [Candidatus Blochmannia herculeanus]
MINFPTKNQLLQNFLSCINWEEKYIYIIDLGKLLPAFPENMRTQKYLISGCQSQTWIALTTTSIMSSHDKSIKLYGYSDSSIVKGIITIIFSLYQGLSLQEVANLDVKPFLINQLQLKQNLSMSRSQGIHLILDSIQSQAKCSM